MTEVWKDISEYEGLYQISSLGKVKRDDKILKYTICSGGYYYISLCKDGIPIKRRIHRLLAETFIPNPDNLQQVDHINQNRIDNRLENLRWVSSSGNNENKGIQINNKLGEQHIYYDKSKNKYTFKIRINKIDHFKRFETLEEAKKYRDKYLIENKI